MMRLIAAPLGALLLVVAANAAPPEPAKAPSSPPRVFLSPSGEPFRATLTGADPFEAWFDQADANHDGVVDRSEFRADALRFFKTLDADGNGVVDGFEIRAYETKIAPELTEIGGGFASASGGDDGQPRRRRGGGDGAHGPKPGGGPAVARLLAEAEPVSGADFDLDGRVSRAEWMRAADERFDLLDTTRTGQLTKAALKARLEVPAKRHR